MNYAFLCRVVHKVLRVFIVVVNAVFSPRVSILSLLPHSERTVRTRTGSSFRKGVTQDIWWLL